MADKKYVKFRTNIPVILEFTGPRSYKNEHEEYGVSYGYYVDQLELDSNNNITNAEKKSLSATQFLKDIMQEQGVGKGAIMQITKEDDPEDARKKRWVVETLQPASTPYPDPDPDAKPSNGNSIQRPPVSQPPAEEAPPMGEAPPEESMMPSEPVGINRPPTEEEVQFRYAARPTNSVGLAGMIVESHAIAMQAFKHPYIRRMLAELDWGTPSYEDIRTWAMSVFILKTGAEERQPKDRRLGYPIDEEYWAGKCQEPLVKLAEMMIAQHEQAIEMGSN